VIFGSTDKRVYALDRNTGQEQWRFETQGQVVSSVVPYSGGLYWGSKDGKVYATQ
jgi:outer membrane protein assembly factor BamB